MRNNITITVGYITDNIVKTKFNTVGFSFTAVDGKGFQLNDLTGPGLHGAEMTADADQIQIWDPNTGTYEMWYYYVCESDHSDDGWWDLLYQSDRFEDVHPDGLPNGSSVWLLSAKESSGGAVSNSGAVDPAKSVTLTLTKGKFNMFANPFPVGLQLNNADQVSWENANGAEMPSQADQIQIWDPTTGTYEMWYYYVYADDHSDDGWWDLLYQSDRFETIHPNGLPAGVPVWYLSNDKSTGTFDVTFKTPMK